MRNTHPFARMRFMWCVLFCWLAACVSTTTVEFKWKKGRDLQCGISTLLFIFSFFSASKWNNTNDTAPNGIVNETKGRDRERDASMQTIHVRCTAKNKSDIINIKIPTQVCRCECSENKWIGNERTIHQPAVFLVCCWFYDCVCRPHSKKKRPRDAHISSFVFMLFVNTEIITPFFCNELTRDTHTNTRSHINWMMISVKIVCVEHVKMGRKMYLPI